MLNTEITFLPNVRRPANFTTIPLRTALLEIKKGAYRKQVEEARTELLLGDDDSYKVKKGALPSYSFQARYKVGGKVSNADFKESTGVFIYDLDKLKDVDSARRVINNFPATVFSFISPSNIGLKAAFRIDPTLITSDADYKIAFTQIEKFLSGYGLLIDGSCKDLRRVTFTSYDPDLYYNKNAEVFPLDMALRNNGAAPSAPRLDYTPIELEDSVNGILPDINFSNAAQYLPTPGEQSYSEWRDIGAILNHQFQGSEEGLALFDAWSQEVREYQGSEDVARQWAAYKRNSGAVVTFRTLIKAHSENNRAATPDELVAGCDDYTVLLQKIAPQLWAKADRNVALEKDYLKLLTDRYASLRPGQTLAKTEAMRAMKMRYNPEKVPKGELMEMNTERTPHWAWNWVWNGELEVFFNVVTRVRLSTRGFRAQFDCRLPIGENAPTDIAKMLLDSMSIPKVERMMYAPAFGVLFTYEGVRYVNSYSESHRCQVPEEIEDQVSVDLFVQHITNICGGWNREAVLLCNYLAYTIGSPIRKVRWAPLLIGTFGDGKSLISKLVSLAIGFSNTRTVSCSTIISAATSGFSGWAEGAGFILVDELKLQGHNRHDVMNSLKAYLTDDVVPCMLKFGEATQIMNAANFWFNSNYKDCCPVEEGNRRLFILHSQLKLALLSENYFDDLHAALDNGTGSIIRFLYDLPFHADFKPNGHAPMTDAKQQSIRLSKDDLTEEVEFVLNEGHIYFSDGIVLFDQLFNYLATGPEGLKLDSKYKLSVALSALGYSKLGRESIKTVRHCIWGLDIDGKAPTSKWAKQQLLGRIKNRKSVEDML